MAKLIRKAMRRTALRKTYLRVDPHIAFPPKSNLADPATLRLLIVDFLEAASRRGLDVIVLASDWLTPGKMAQAIVRQHGIDLAVFPAQELVSKDNIHTLAVGIDNEIQQRLPIEEQLKQIHRQKGYAIVIAPNKQASKKMNKIVEEPWAPMGIEVFNDTFSEFVDNDIDSRYEFLLSSGSTRPSDLLDTQSHTRMPTDIWAPLMQKSQLGVDIDSD